jgi:hypothetical protein
VSSSEFIVRERDHRFVRSFDGGFVRSTEKVISSIASNGGFVRSTEISEFVDREQDHRLVHSMEISEFVDEGEIVVSFVRWR